jgi:hypothetical protein
MTPGKAWAGIFAGMEFLPQPDPHPASAMVLVEDFRVMSSVLPWRGCGPSWEGATLEEKMRGALSSLRVFIDEGLSGRVTGIKHWRPVTTSAH